MHILSQGKEDLMVSFRSILRMSLSLLLLTILTLPSVHAFATEGNTAPIANNDNLIFSAEGGTTRNLLQNDIDSQGGLYIESIEFDTNIITALDGVFLFSLDEDVFVTVQSNGDTTIAFPEGYYGVLPQFSYTISDGEFSDTATVNSQVRIYLSLISDDISVDYGGSVSGNVFDNDSSQPGTTLQMYSIYDGQELLYLESNLAEYIVDYDFATLTIQPNGDYTLVAKAGQSGSSSRYRYNAGDGLLYTNAVMYVTVHPSTLQVVNDEFTTPQGQSLFTNVFDNDTIPESGVITSYTVGEETFDAGDITQINDSNFSIQSNGELVYYTNPSYFGTLPPITYTVAYIDQQVQASVTITVAEYINNAPIATYDILNILLGENQTINLLDNDTDEDEDQLFISGLALGDEVYLFSEQSTPSEIQPICFACGGNFGVEADTQYGFFRILSNGNFTFEANTDFIGELPAFTYTVSDGTDSVEAQIYVTVESPLPTTIDARDDGYGLKYGGGVFSGFLDNDYNSSQNPLYITEIYFNGVYIDVIDGSAYYENEFFGLEILGNYGYIVYNDGFDGSDLFLDYTVSNGIESDIATILFQFSDQPLENPIAVEDTVTIHGGQTGIFNVLLNDSHPQSADMIMNEMFHNDNFYWTQNEYETEYGTLYFELDGTVYFSPYEVAEDITIQFVYNIASSLSTEAQAVLTINILAGEPDVIAHDDVKTVLRPIYAVDSILKNDINSGDQELIVTDIFSGDVQFRYNEEVGLFEYSDESILLQIQENGVIIIYSNPVMLRNTYSFVYTASNGESSASAMVTLNFVDDNDNTYEAVDDIFTTQKGQTLKGNLLINDINTSGLPDALVVVGDPETIIEGGITVLGENEIVLTIDQGTLTVNSNGDFTFVPAPDFVGTVPPLAYLSLGLYNNLIFIMFDEGLTESNYEEFFAQAQNSIATLQIEVTENTSAPVSTPSTDDDNDGVPNIIEQNGINNGDANNDAIPDYLQPNVATVLTPKGYVTIVVSGVLEGCNQLTNVAAISQSSLNTPSTNQDFQDGLVTFTSPCADQLNVTQYWHGSDPSLDYNLTKYGPTIPGDLSTIAYYNFDANFSLTKMNGIDVVTVSYVLRDGFLGDDTAVDGQIVDPVGITMSTNAATMLVATGGQSMSTRPFIIAVMIIALIHLLVIAVEMLNSKIEI